MRIEVEGIGVIEIDSLDDVPLLLELLENETEEAEDGEEETKTSLLVAFKDLIASVKAVPAPMVTCKPVVNVDAQRMPERAIVRIAPEDIDEAGNIAKADVEFFYARG